MRSMMTAAALVLLATPAMAVTTKIYVSGQGGTPVDQTLAGPQTVTDVFGGSSYTASASAGVLKAGAGSTAPAGVGACCTYQPEGIGVTTSFTDVLTMNTPGISSGSFTASLLIDGMLTADSAGLPSSGVFSFAAVEILVRVASLPDPVFSFSYTRSNYNGFIAGSGSLNGMRYSGPLIGAFDFSIPFDSLVGQEVTVQLFYGTNTATLQAGDSASAACDYSHTLVWGGVSQVLDGMGAPVTNYSLTGATGANYAQSFAGAVPEPASWAMMLAGFGLAGVMLRRQRRALPA